MRQAPRTGTTRGHDGDRTPEEQLAELLTRRLIVNQIRHVVHTSTTPTAPDREDQEAWVRGKITLTELAQRAQHQRYTRPR